MLQFVPIYIKGSLLFASKWYWIIQSMVLVMAFWKGLQLGQFHPMASFKWLFLIFVNASSFWSYHIRVAVVEGFRLTTSEKWADYYGL